MIHTHTYTHTQTHSLTNKKETCHEIFDTWIYLSIHLCRGGRFYVHHDYQHRRSNGMAPTYKFVSHWRSRLSLLLSAAMSQLLLLGAIGDHHCCDEWRGMGENVRGWVGHKPVQMWCQSPISHTLCF